MSIASEETILLRHIWKKAYKDDVVIRLGDAKEAARIRFALYNVAKPVKAGKVKDDELLTAVTNCGITFEDAKTLRVARRLTGTLSALAESIGFDLDAALESGEGVDVSPEEVEAQASLNRLLDKINNPEKAESRVTPFYTRGAD